VNRCEENTRSPCPDLNTHTHTHAPTHAHTHTESGDKQAKEEGEEHIRNSKDEGGILLDPHIMFFSLQGEGTSRTFWFIIEGKLAHVDVFV